ncbi:hypothetical protein O7632_14595 [Solwaraspora sp. WMMD406]|uniref:hypothetical protein n=1 Tax=Solwaraspora sp. WMMD406 TaxID=3016095 RepID=UPI002417C916|nr:hypothetical protein [Solwaraspora sp. WMMD406]MDG4765313.1 hypothetical protein [Solwaraspora sp. WMMD406]
MTTLGLRFALAAAATVAIGLTGCGAAENPTPGSDSASVDPSGVGGLGGAPSAATDGSEPADGASGTSGDSGQTGDGATGGGNNGNSGNGNSGGGNSGSTGGGQSTGPTIVSFAVTGEPSCPAGTTLAPIDGTPVTLAWKTTGQPTVSLSVDGPGVYQSYEGPEGSETLSFPCAGAPGSYQKHTYTLTVTEDGATAEKTITVKAIVNEIAVVEQ